MNILVLTGGLEEDPFTAALTKALRTLDHRVTTLSPLYSSIDPSQRALARRLVKLSAVVEGVTYACELYTGRNIHGVEQVFIGHPELFASAADLSDGEPEVVQRRLAVFAQAAAAFVRDDITVGAEIVHGLGAAGAAVLRELAEADHQTPRVLSADAATLGSAIDLATTLIAETASEADAVLAILAQRHADDREGKFVRVVRRGHQPVEPPHGRAPGVPLRSHRPQRQDAQQDVAAARALPAGAPRGAAGGRGRQRA